MSGSGDRFKRIVVPFTDGIKTLQVITDLQKAFETDGKQVVNSDQILELETVPKSLVVIGSGAVGVEFASVYARFGAETTVVELLDRIVPIEDAEVSKQLARSFKKQKIKVMTGIALTLMASALMADIRCDRRTC